MLFVREAMIAESLAKIEPALREYVGVEVDFHGTSRYLHPTNAELRPGF